MGAYIVMFRTMNLRQWLKRTKPATAIQKHTTELGSRMRVTTEEVLSQSRNAVLEPMTRSSTIPEVAADDTASQLARIWEKLLGIESVGLDQNYFDLGGDSSLTIQLFVQIEKTFGVKVPVVTLFEAPTVRELATVIQEAKSDYRR
jgi:acyl carrier protein